jgi:hypothetical protein
LTDSKQQHPWAKYYEERGISRPPVATLPRRRSNAPGTGVANQPAPKRLAISSDLAAAVAAVTSSGSAPAGTTAAPFITAMQKEAAVRAAKRQTWIRFGRIAAAAVAVVAAIHFAVTRVLYRAPAETAVLAHVQGLPEAIVPLFSSSRQPLQADGVVISQADQIDAAHFRYVATVTLRLRKPLYVPAVTNGTAQYRRLQDALERARDQDLRYKLFTDGDEPDAPTLPLLLQRTHQAGETIVVRVPFTARRFGWQWRIDAAQLALGTPNHFFQGDTLERYAGTPHLIFGTPAALAEIRERTKLANNYVLAVAKAVQRHADVEAVAVVTPTLADRPAQPSLADLPAQPAVADQSANPATVELGVMAHVAARPAVDPDAPAVFLPSPVKFFSAAPRSSAR